MEGPCCPLCKSAFAVPLARRSCEAQTEPVAFVRLDEAAPWQRPPPSLSLAPCGGTLKVADRAVRGAALTSRRAEGKQKSAGLAVAEFQSCLEAVANQSKAEAAALMSAVEELQLQWAAHEQEALLRQKLYFEQRVSDLEMQLRKATDVRGRVGQLLQPSGTLTESEVLQLVEQAIHEHDAMRHSGMKTKAVQAPDIDALPTHFSATDAQLREAIASLPGRRADAVSLLQVHGGDSLAFHLPHIANAPGGGRSVGVAGRTSVGSDAPGTYATPASRLYWQHRAKHGQPAPPTGARSPRSARH